MTAKMVKLRLLSIRL